ncbi:unnamed protein product [Auanema sp. JU1783]|nr:unnamed protein product [Auanema sp. JU1783]
MPSEWHERSFFLEVKPRTELASLFVDCPPNGDGEEKENNCLDMVRVSENSVELGIPPSIAEQIPSFTVTPQLYSAKISGLYLAPDSVCSPTWADNKRLFMCKVRAARDCDQPLVPKQFHRLAKEISPIEPIETYINSNQDKPIQINCNQCNVTLLSEHQGNISMGCLPCDDWLETTPSVDYFCRDTCGAGCDPNRHGHHRNGIESEGAHTDWLPTPSKIMISHSYIVLHRDICPDKVFVEDKHALCAACHGELGFMVPNKNSLIMLHHSTSNLIVNGKPFLAERFIDRSMFFTQMLLSSCEAKASLKLVIRSLDKTPHILVWILDSYVLLASGDLTAVDKNGEQGRENIKPFPAIKMLYKVFDAETAASDPRANGEDASVGLIDLPLPCCIQLMETLLLSSHSLPPACRSVGQFYVGFLRLSETS